MSSVRWTCTDRPARAPLRPLSGQRDGLGAIADVGGDEIDQVLAAYRTRKEQLLSKSWSGSDQSWSRPTLPEG